MKILILSGKFGMGHWSAANALRQSLGIHMPEAQVNIVDLFQCVAPGCADAIYRGFTFLVTHGGSLYNTYYRCTEKTVQPEGRHTCLLPLLDKVEELLQEEKPDGIISTLPLCAQLLSCYKRERGLWAPLVTCITDLSIHPEWINWGTDCYMVGSREVRDGLVAQGVERERILITGIPVRPEFHAPACRLRRENRELLLMGGGLGLLPREESFYQALNDLPNTHTTVLTGSNRKLHQRLSGRYPNLTAVSFTPRVREYMLNADLMVSKPGGITLFEAISTGVPLLMPKPFLQQEINNADFAVRRGIAQVAEKGSDACLAAIRRLLDHPEQLRRMSDNMARLRGELAAQCEGAMMRTLVSGGRCA